MTIDIATAAQVHAVPQSDSHPNVLVDTGVEQAMRWRPGERMHHLFADVVAAHSSGIAMDMGDCLLSFADVADRAAAITAMLRVNGVRAGDRVALFLDDLSYAYAGMVAVSRMRAAYVPLDPSFPPDRVAYICQDAEVAAILTSDSLRARLPGLGSSVRVLDVAECTTGSSSRLPDDDEVDGDGDGDDLAYIVYTSGTTGRPKGVAVAQSSICNFLRVAAECYGFRRDDRVYAGMTIAFDFSVEESWVPWMTGATLVPRPQGGPLIGDDLTAFLVERRVTALCCVPTLLATLDEHSLDALRFVLVSGEACSQDLATRWYRRGRRFLNVYGPTEATVTATWSILAPGDQVSLGLPLATYTVVVLRPETAELAAPGELGEIAIAGPGLARGYLNRPDLTQQAFVPDFLHLPVNPSGRLYRTGDLGRINDDGRLSYHGRIDTQVKIRGYRIELTEIESVLLAVPGIAQAVVDVWSPPAGTPELVAWYSLRSHVAPENVSHDALRARLGEFLPEYMVPRWYQRVDQVPLTTAGKADRRSLPDPDISAAVGGLVVAPIGDVEQRLTEVAKDVLNLAEVSVVADFFADLGANSLLMARLCGQAREVGLPVSIRDVYEASSVRGLAALLDQRTGAMSASRPSVPARTVPSPRTSPGRRSVSFVLTGFAQLAIVFGYLGLQIGLFERVYNTVGHGSSLAGEALRVMVLASYLFVSLAVAPIALKWLLVGRWRAGEFDVWGVRYLRLWTVKALVRSNVLVLFAGTPLYSLYLRALGVRVGPRALILTRHVPTCTDLVTIGADTVVRRDVYLPGYRVDAGRVRTGPITLGARAYVGESAVLDIETSIEDDAQLAHASSLLAGQTVPTGQSWYGSPGRPTPKRTDFRGLPIAEASRGHGLAVAATVAGQAVGGALLIAVFFLLPLIWVLLAFPASSVAGISALAVTASAALLVVELLLQVAAALGLARLARRSLRTDVVYPLHGFRHAMVRLVDVGTNHPFLTSLLGDSAAITRWLGALGWDLGRVEQTGSNFGTAHHQDIPHLSAAGRGTMISDGLSMASATYSSTGFRLRRASIGERNFLGNRIVFPADARTGDNVLLATKVFVPTDGPIHHDTGLLGSPSFEIPRIVNDAARHRPDAGELPQLLAAKYRHNVRSMLALLGSRWLSLSAFTVIELAAIRWWPHALPVAVPLATIIAIAVDFALAVVIERLAAPGRRLRPRTCSIYSSDFWAHERLWKLLVPQMAMLDGTPFKPLALRAVGVRVGRRLFDDGAQIPEHALVSIGDDCTLNAGATIQCHSLEDGMFTSDTISLGAGVTVGVAAWVHYGVRMDDSSVLDTDSFLMKGSHVPAHAVWVGNPAAEANQTGPVGPTTTNAGRN